MKRKAEDLNSSDNDSNKDKSNDNNSQSNNVNQNTFFWPTNSAPQYEQSQNSVNASAANTFVENSSNNNNNIEPIYFTEEEIQQLAQTLEANSKMNASDFWNWSSPLDGNSETSNNNNNNYTLNANQSLTKINATPQFHIEIQREGVQWKAICYCGDKWKPLSSLSILKNNNNNNNQQISIEQYPQNQAIVITFDTISKIKSTIQVQLKAADQETKKAWQELLDEVKEEYELFIIQFEKLKVRDEEIQGKGLGFDQIIYALKFYFNDNKEYIVIEPGYHASEQILEIKKKMLMFFDGTKIAFIPYAAHQNEHCVLIKVDPFTKTLTLFDSQSDYRDYGVEANLKILEDLKKNLPQLKDYQYEIGQSNYLPQNEAWPCGIYSIQTALDIKEGTRLNQPVQLELNPILRRYYRAAQAWSDFVNKEYHQRQGELTTTQRENVYNALAQQAQTSSSFVNEIMLALNNNPNATDFARYAMLKFEYIDFDEPDKTQAQAHVASRLELLNKINTWPVKALSDVDGLIENIFIQDLDPDSKIQYLNTLLEEENVDTWLNENYDLLTAFLSASHEVKLEKDVLKQLYCLKIVTEIEQLKLNQKK